QACVQALKDGLIDCIATDHAPHADFEKEKEFDHAPFGIVGLETAFPVLYKSLVLTKQITLARLVDALSSAPAKVLNLPGGSLCEGKAADLTIIDLNQESLFTESSLLSKGKNTPWLNESFPAKVLVTICNGSISYQDENF
ncbi:MAG: amidohydrolase family protein, partial [Candidatus Cloacimonetes bacterium]|nr:amidohydrolase family protein [Candidatus Cloacimonadota bacterium]